MVNPEIERINQVDRKELLNKRKTNIDDKPTFVMTYHLPLTCIYERLRKAKHHALKSPTLALLLPAPPSLSFRSSKILKNLDVKSKLSVQSSMGNAEHKCPS